jgi:NAD(P)-dependent dehydrogenase (short-subunit alcohol dehydrogenase family)
MAKALVIGASRGIGLETVRAALRAGHSVRALARSAASIPIQNVGLDKVPGNALDSDMIRNALQDIEVVIKTSRWLSRRSALTSLLGRSSSAPRIVANQAPSVPSLPPTKP